MTNLDSTLKQQRHCFASKGQSSQGYGFPSGHVWIWELNYQEGWVLKNWCFWTVVLEKTLESPLNCKEIQPVHPKGDQSWVFIGRTDVEAETPILWPCDAKSWLIGKDRDAGKDWGQEERGMTEDEMVGWHHRLNGHGFRWTPGAGDGQRTWHAVVHRVARSWIRLNVWTELNWKVSEYNLYSLLCLWWSSSEGMSFHSSPNWMEVTVSYFFGVLQERHLNSFLKCLLH